MGVVRELLKVGVGVDSFGDALSRASRENHMDVVQLLDGKVETYRPIQNAVIQAANLCAVKKHMENSPRFNVFTS